MKTTILLLAVSVFVFSSCNTAYKTGQTPDDVYFSPTRPEREEVFSERYDDKESRYTDEYYDDRYLRMKVHNRTRWSNLDDWYYYDRYSLGYNYYYGSYHNPYNSWNYYYNPYCCCHTNNVYSNPKTNTAYNKPRMFNLGSYNINNNSTSSNPKVGAQTTTNSNTYNGPRNSSNSGRSNNSGNILRNIFNNGNSSSSSSSNHNSSSGNNNNSSSSSSSSSGSSSSSSSTPAPVRKF